MNYQEDLKNMWNCGYDCCLKSVIKELDILKEFENIESIHIWIDSIKRIYKPIKKIKKTHSRKNNVKVEVQE